MPACVVSSCKNHHNKGFVLLRFPRDEQLRQQWQEAIGPYGPPEWQPTKDYRICEVHFTRDDWRKYRWYLKDGTVPSVFEGSPTEKISGVRTSLLKKERGKRKKPPTTADSDSTKLRPLKVTPTGVKATFVKQPFTVPFLRAGSTQAKHVLVFLSGSSLQCSESAKLPTNSAQCIKSASPQVKNIEDLRCSETAKQPSSDYHSEGNVCPQAKSVEELFSENGLNWAETGTHFLSSLM